MPPGPAPATCCPHTCEVSAGLTQCGLAPSLCHLGCFCPGEESRWLTVLSLAPQCSLQRQRRQPADSGTAWGPCSPKASRKRTGSVSHVHFILPPAEPSTPGWKGPGRVVGREGKPGGPCQPDPGLHGASPMESRASGRRWTGRVAAYSQEQEGERNTQRKEEGVWGRADRDIPARGQGGR